MNYFSLSDNNNVFLRVAYIYSLYSRLIAEKLKDRNVMLELDHLLYL